MMNDENMNDEQHELGLDQEYMTTDDANVAAMFEDDDDDEDYSSILPDFNPMAQQAQDQNGAVKTYMKINVPQHRLTPLRNTWQHICEPITTHMGLAIRYNQDLKAIELLTTQKTIHPNAIQKAHDFCKAFCLGFELRDAIALLRLDDLYIDSFELKDVKILNGDNLSRAIGRIAGHGGKTKFTIENATKTRIVLADTYVHVLGSYQNIRVAKRALSRLVIGAPPGKIYNQMSRCASRNKQRM